VDDNKNNKERSVKIYQYSNKRSNIYVIKVREERKKEEDA
jgi:hypothetical protein